MPREALLHWWLLHWASPQTPPWCVAACGRVLWRSELTSRDIEQADEAARAATSVPFATYLLSANQNPEEGHVPDQATMEAILQLLDSTNAKFKGYAIASIREVVSQLDDSDVKTKVRDFVGFVLQR
jgi:hypothetical protein